MGGLRPIGSEKLQGMDKIRRIMEIARYNENIPQPVNENKSTEYTAELADGNTYTIVREKSGYIIKKSITESVNDYIEPIQNRKYFSSYSEALKKLNLMAKDFNVTYGNDEGMSLFTEQKKKYKLKLGKKKPAADEAPVGDVTGGELPPPVPAPATPAPAPTGDMGGELPPAPEGGMGDMGVDLPPPTGDMGMEGEIPPAPEGDDMSGELPPPPGDEDMEDEDLPPSPDDEDMEDEEKSTKKGEATTFKVIQKLTGKLAQRIRKFNSEDDMDPNDVKYIINSILSALDVDLLDDDDLEEIISRLEGDFEEDEDKDEEDVEDEDMDGDLPPVPEDEDMEGELPPPPEAPEGGEMKEYELGEIASLSDAIDNSIGGKFAGTMYDKMKELPSMGEMGEEYGQYGARKPRHTYNHLEHGTFGESKVDKIISKYFETNKKDIISEEKKRINVLEEKEKVKTKNYKDIKDLSENIKQERAAFKYLENNPKSKLVGKTNKGNLIFNEGVVQTKITINGLVI